VILRGDYSSDVLRTTVNVQFIIPEKCDGPFKVTYLLHGLHGNQGSWMDYSMLPFYGKDYNTIFVMPETGRSFYYDLKHGRNFSTFILDELPLICKKIFNISDKREDTAIMGNSMGGYGALKLALTKPQQYGFCAAISTACLYFKPVLDALREDASAYLKTGAEAQEIMKDLSAIFGEDLKYRPDGDILELINNFPAGKPKPKIYATCGTEDIEMIKDNQRFRDEMKDKSFDFTYEEWSGVHDWNFFNDALKKSLEQWFKG